MSKLKTILIINLFFVAVFFFSWQIFAFNNDIQNGQITEISKIINPQTAQYADCNFTIKIKLLSGKNEELILIAPLFRNRILEPESKLKKGDIIKFKPLSDKEVPQNFSTVQLLDDINDYEHPQYFILHVLQDRNKTERNDPAVAHLMQQKKILLEDIESRIDKYQKSCAQIQPQLKKFWNEVGQQRYPSVMTKKGFFSLHADGLYRNTFSGYINPIPYNPSLLVYLKDMNEFFAKKNIPLIIIIVPTLDELFYDEILHDFGECPFLNIARTTLVRDCLKNGIMAVDPFPVMLEKRAANRFLYCYNIGDLHLSPLGHYFMVSYLAKMAGLPVNQKLSSHTFLLNSAYATKYTGPIEMEIPLVDKPAQSERSFFVFGDSFTLETFGFPDSLRNLFNANVNVLSMLSRGSTIYYNVIELSKEPETSPLKNIDAAFFVISAGYIYNNYETNELIKIKANVLQKKAMVINNPILQISADKKTNYYQFKLPENLRQASKLVVAFYTTCKVYEVHCNGKLVFSYNSSSWPENDLNSAYFYINGADVTNGNIRLDFSPELKSSMLSTIYVDQASNNAMDISCAPEKTPYNLTDNNWINGISRHWTGLFISLSKINLETYKKGRFLIFANGDKRKIINVVITGHFINIYLDGHKLDPQKVGYPHEIICVDK